MQNRRAAHRAALPLLTLLAALPAAAESPEPTRSLPEVRVNADAERETAATPVIGYKARHAATATKTDTPLIETPQSVTVVTRDQIVDQGATNVQDALNYAAGVRSNAYGIDSRNDGVRIRGSFPEEYQDGLRRMFDWYTSNTRVEPFLLERIEVLRGPSSMLFGQSNTAGIVNMVSKRPQAQRQGEVGVQLGSWGRKQVQADLTGPLTADGQWLYRLIAVGRDADTQVDHVRDDRALLAPSLTWRPGAATSLTLQGLWQEDRSGSTSQFFPWRGVLLPNPNGPIPSNRFIGEPGFDRYDSSRRSVGWLFEHRFSEQLAVRQNVRMSRNEVDYFTMYGDSFTLPGGWAQDPVNERVLGRFVQAEHSRTRMTVADQHLQADFRTGAVAHKLLAGLDHANYHKDVRAFYDYPAAYGGTAPPIDVYEPVYVGYTPGPMTDQPGSSVRQTGVYLQDQLRWDNWILVAGLRHDRARNRLGTSESEVSANTRRLGLLYALPSGLSPYVSYSESFSPQMPATLATGVQVALQPLRGKQLEAGVKYEPPAAGWVFTAAAYTLREQNRVQNNGTSVVQLPDTRTHGLELEYKGRVSAAFDVVANYTYTNVDEDIEEVPSHQASLWGRYRFALGGVTGFSAGAGVRHMSAFADGAGPTVPAVTLLDLMLGYDVSNWRLALNVNNATDKVYASTCLRRGDCWFGARRNVVASATYLF